MPLAQVLTEARASIVAIDALGIDSTADAGDNAHEILFAADVLVAENLRGLGDLASGHPYSFAFLPLALAAADGSPAQDVAWESELGDPWSPDEIGTNGGAMRLRRIPPLH